MIDDSQAIFYLSYAFIAAMVGVAYLKVSSTEGVTITTKEFKIFQQSFLTGYSIMILCELIAAASFFHTFVYLNLTIEQITKLYVVTIFSSTMFGIVQEVIDIGSRKDKCVLSALLYGISMCSIFLGGHFDRLLLGRVIYGAASSLHHASFEAYVIHEHAILGFPEDWLSHTFTLLSHCMAVIAVLSGFVGQSAASSGPLGPVALCSCVFILCALYLLLAWTKDTNGPKFMLSNFSYNVSQTLSSLRSSRQLVLVLLISSLCEAAITVFTYYWAPWLTQMAREESHRVPYEIIFSAYISSSMLGNYIYQLFSTAVGPDNALQAILFCSAAAFFLGSVFQTPMMAFGVSLIVQLCVGGYWPSIGLLRGRSIVPEIKSTALVISRCITLAISFAVLTCIHHSPFLTLTACATLFSAAAYLHTILPQGSQNIGDDDADEEDDT